MLFVSLFCQIFLGIIFSLSAISKLQDIATFEDTINALAFVPRSMTPVAARIVLFLEAGIPLLMLIRHDAVILFSFSIAILLLLTFTLVLLYIIRRNITTSCNCFGHLSDDDISIYAVVRNIGLISIATLGLIATWLEPVALYTPGMEQIGLLALLAGLSVMLWLNIKPLAKLFF